MTQREDELVARKMDHWRSRLIDLSLRNRLLNFKMTRSSTMQFVEPAMSEVFDQLAIKNRPLSIICPEIRDEQDGPKDGSRECLLLEKITVLPGQILPSTINPNTEKVLYQTRLKARTFMQEHGVNVLYMTFGILKWTDAADPERQLSAPILLVPAQLGKKVNNPYVLARFGDEPIINPSLAIKLKNDHGIELPPLPEDTDDIVLEQYLKLVDEVVTKKENWNVARESYLGLFSFTKLVMFEDLRSNEDVAMANPVIRALAGDPSLLPQNPTDAPTADRLDETVMPKDEHHIMDADSSQFEAVEAVRRGANMVLQGPPGTGKSQTITNIIAECLWSGKTVLFVSEKMAALAVVKKRLDSCRLGDYCLVLHSNAPNKGEVITSLGAALDSTESTKEPDLTDLDRVESSRERLNAYVHFMNMKMGELGLSLFDAYGKLASLNGVPELPFRLDGPLEVTRQRMDSMVSAIERLVARKDVLASRGAHPWNDMDLIPLDMGSQQEFVHSLKTISSSLDPLMTAVNGLTGDLGLSVPATLQDCDKLLGLLQKSMTSPSPPGNWVDPLQIERLILRAEAGEASFKALGSNRASLLAKYRKEVLDIDGDHFVKKFEGEYNTTLRGMSSDYRADIKVLASHLSEPRKLDFEEALNDVRALKAFQDAKRSLNSTLTDDYKSFGRSFDGPNTDWGRLLSSLRWTRSFIQDAGRWLDAAMKGIVCDRTKLVTYQAALVQCQGLLREVNDSSAATARFVRGGILSVSGIDIKDVPMAELREWLAKHSAATDRLREWVELREAEDGLTSTGLGPMLDLLRKGDVDVTRLKDMFRKRYYTLFVDSVHQHLPLLSSFKSAEHIALIADFRKLDEGLLFISRKRLANRLRERVRSAHEGDPAGPVRMQETILRKEMAKRSKHMAVRKLLSEIPDLLPIVKPCVMMSPMTASQYIDPKRHRFDVIIFDEASQICPEDAVGPIMRGRQLVVVGDSKQLPPARFFDKLEVDEDEEVQDLESILDECATIGLPQKMLLWHYRSRNESLIAFSNAHYYGNKLYTFPSADLPGPSAGIDFVHVPDGVYDRGGRRDNKIEAKKVADMVFEQFKAHPEMSLGVVAFSEEQQLAILDVIEYQKKVRPEYQQYFDEGHEESFFVKNLENVQGDERDVMFFSVGYGKDQTGVMTMGFGPLNLEGGHRRLNVAITRARRSVKLFSSMQPEDLDASSKSLGVVLLRRYMEFARSRGDRSTLGVSMKLYEEGVRPMEDSIYTALTSMGLEVHRDVGCSGYRVDLAVMDPEKRGRFIIGIECDGASYASGKTGRDRDRLRESVLTGLGWHMHRIWARDWVEDRNRELRMIEALVDRYRSR